MDIDKCLFNVALVKGPAYSRRHRGDQSFWIPVIFQSQERVYSFDARYNSLFLESWHQDLYFGVIFPWCQESVMGQQFSSKQILAGYIIDRLGVQYYIAWYLIPRFPWAAFRAAVGLTLDINTLYPMFNTTG